MDPFCNSCFRQYGELDCDLFCTQCHHVVCKTCILRNSERCAVCNENCRLIKVCQGMPENMTKFFKDPLPELENLRKIVKFQEEQRSFHSGHVKRIFQEHESLRMDIVKNKKIYDDLRKQIKDAERLLKGSDKGSFSNFQTPQSSVSGTSSSQFTANASAIEQKTAMSDSSFWKDSPASAGSDTFRYGMSRLTIRDGKRK